MKGIGEFTLKLAAGTFVTALCALPQGYTISARPGAINYVEGAVQLDDKTLSSTAAGQTFLTANDILSTQAGGKAEVLLTPGVFVRLGSDSSIRMISPTLTDTRMELLTGSAMVEVNELTKDNDIRVLDHGSTTSLEKTGLYRFSAGAPPTALVLDGKAIVEMGDRKVSLGKNHQTVLSADLKSEKFKDEADQDDLYAWSKVRDEYGSAASYASLRSVGATSLTNSGLGYDGFGYGGLGYSGLGIRPGWFWNSGFSSWAWLPGTNAYYSPFGYGFFSPSVIGYAPLVYAPLRGHPGVYAVPVNPTRTPAVAGIAKPAIVTPSGARFGATQRSALAMRTAPAGPSGGGAAASSRAAAAGPGLSGGGRAMSTGSVGHSAGTAGAHK